MPVKYICDGCEDDPCIIEIAAEATNLPGLCPWGDKAEWVMMRPEKCACGEPAVDQGWCSACAPYAHGG